MELTVLDPPRTESVPWESSPWLPGVELARIQDWEPAGVPSCLAARDPLQSPVWQMCLLPLVPSPSLDKLCGLFQFCVDRDSFLPRGRWPRSCPACGRGGSCSAVSALPRVRVRGHVLVQRVAGLRALLLLLANLICY